MDIAKTTLMMKNAGSWVHDEDHVLRRVGVKKRDHKEIMAIITYANLQSYRFCTQQDMMLWTLLHDYIYFVQIT
jgi:hypothetical protein